MKKLFLFLLLISFVFPIFSLARIGVGVGTGKIQFEKPLKPGGNYSLGTLGVLNTGDEAGDYEIEITYHQDQTQLKPPQKWFSFDPPRFYLNPGELKNVIIRLNLPVKTKPGDYFAFVEAHPLMKPTEGGATIGVAAAAKLYFSVAPANIFQGIYYWIVAFLTKHSPWTWIILVLIIGAVIVLLVKRFVKFNIAVSRK